MADHGPDAEPAKSFNRPNHLPKKHWSRPDKSIKNHAIVLRL